MLHRSRGGAQQLLQAVGGDLLHISAQEEAVVEGIQLLILWQLIAGANETEQRHTHSLRPVVESALVEEREEGVEHCAVRLEDLIYESHRCCRQIPIRLPAVLILLKAAQRERSEQLLRDTEAGDQPLKEAALHQNAEATPDFALRSAWLAEEEQIFAAQQGQEKQADL